MSLSPPIVTVAVVGTAAIVIAVACTTAAVIGLVITTIIAIIVIVVGSGLVAVGSFRLAKTTLKCSG